MTINLSENREQFVRSLVSDGRFASEDEVVDEALRQFEERARQRAIDKRHLESLLLEGINSGPSVPMTSQDWEEIRQEGLRIIAARQLRNGR